MAPIWRIADSGIHTIDTNENWKRKKAEPYCDCEELNILNGNPFRATNVRGRMFVTQVKPDDSCVHCKHQVFWAYENPYEQLKKSKS